MLCKAWEELDGEEFNRCNLTEEAEDYEGVCHALVLLAWLALSWRVLGL